MRKNFTLIAIASMALLCSCEENQPVIHNVGHDGATLYATLEQPAETKTELQLDGSVLWEPSEEIMVFCGTKSGKFTSTNTEPSSAATFKGEMSISQGSDIWALYPYDENATISDGIITTTIPCDQVAVPGTFARNANVTVAHSTTTDLQFYNVCGGVRFSVTEAGISKVIFEGLGGEAIAGKVKIGFENGLPTVQEVTDARLFITLTAPDGASFEVGKWYYIAAIPGALEKGYKLRFYKDETYGKVASEKSVTVKRSVFGSLARVDQEAAYNAQTIKFPTTSNEIKEALNRSQSIASTVNNVMTSLKGEDSDVLYDASEIAREIGKIEEVASVEVSEDGLGIIIMQRDGVYLNLSLDDYNMTGSESINLERPSYPTFNYAEPDSKMLSDIVVPTRTKKKALLLSPYQSSYMRADKVPFEIDVIGLKNELGRIGIDLVEHLNEDASIKCFSQDTLSKYDLIFIATHGSINEVAHADGVKSNVAFYTGTKIGTVEDTEYFKTKCLFISHGEVYYSVTGHNLESNGDTQEACVYNNSIVCAFACNSYRYSDMAKYFIWHGAAAYCGCTYFENITQVNNSIFSIVDYLSQGYSVQSACAETTEDHPFICFGLGSFVSSVESYGPVHLFDPSPYNLRKNINGNKVTLIWDNPVSTGLYKRYVHVKKDKSVNEYIYDSETERAVTIDVNEPGEYSWYVESQLLDKKKNKLVETFTSEEKSFFIEGDNSLKASILERGSEHISASIEYNSTSFRIIEAIGLVVSSSNTDPEIGGQDCISELIYYPETSGNFICSIANLKPGTKYYVRAIMQAVQTGSNMYVDYYSDVLSITTASSTSSPNAVDLGLSVKWSSCDIGAYNNHDQGLEYTYNDACSAVANLVGGWRLPTREEWLELADSCNWSETSINGVYGFSAVSKINGNSIFFPCSKARTYVGYLVYYWSSTGFYSDMSYLYSCSIFTDNGVVPECNGGHSASKPIRARAVK